MARPASAVAMQRNDGARPPDGRGRPAHLSRDRIIQGAIALLDAEGPAGLSMRRLADTLDAGAMSLYWYVPAKDALLQLAADAVLAEVRRHDLPEDWRGASRHLAHDLRRVMRRHPWLALLLTTQPNLGPNGLALVETMLATLTRAGLTGTGLDTAMTTLYGYVLGLAIGETLWDTANREPLQPTGGVDPETAPERPLLTAFLASTSAIASDDRFAAGLDLVLDGIAAKRPDHPAGDDHPTNHA
ncbi:MAG: TetR/AcrR family transcriptional regulator [Chloroflexota bacterium]|nr:TetR/AcrR family transcriptional regulator [Chloroflexota bacterium]